MTEDAQLSLEKKVQRSKKLHNIENIRNHGVPGSTPGGPIFYKNTKLL